MMGSPVQQGVATIFRLLRTAIAALGFGRAAQDGPIAYLRVRSRPLASTRLALAALRCMDAPMPDSPGAKSGLRRRKSFKLLRLLAAAHLEGRFGLLCRILPYIMCFS